MREWAKEKSPSPTRSMRSVGVNGIVGTAGWADLEGLVEDVKCFGTAFAGLWYGLDFEALSFDLFAFPIVQDDSHTRPAQRPRYLVRASTSAPEDLPCELHQLPSNSTSNNATSMTSSTDEQNLEAEIARLETQLSAARAPLTNASAPKSPTISTTTPPPTNTFFPSPTASLPYHPLLLLSDSALPLGSFAFSSGLESYLAHHSTTKSTPSILENFPHFLALALSSLATTTLPYLIAAYVSPERLQALDAELDACILCPVARRASVAQGRALLTLWERALKDDARASSAARTLEIFSKAMKAPRSTDDEEIELSGHFAPIWAAVTSAMDIGLNGSAYTFLFNHAKAVVSAAVRASVMGPYKAQGVLASGWLRGEIEDAMAANWKRKVEEAGQGVVMLDLWVGRHELLYSRIFNS